MHEERAGRVTTFLTLSWDMEQDHLGSGVDDIANDCKAGDQLLRGRPRRGIKQVKPMVRGKPIIEGDAQKAVFNQSFDVDVTGEHDGRSLRLVYFNISSPFDVKNTSIRRDG